MSDIKKILIVEDELSLREIISSILIDEHYEVVTAKDGVDALECIEKIGQDQISLVLSDIHMPKMDGLQFFAQYTYRKYKSPFIFITTFNDGDNIVKALRLGAFDFIKKPFNAIEVLDVVARAMDVGRRMEEIQKHLHKLPVETLNAVNNHYAFIELLKLTNNQKRSA